MVGAGTLALPSTSAAAAGRISVYVGYADLHHGSSPGTPGPNFPSPWIGDSNVVAPHDTGNWDAGAIRVDNGGSNVMSALITVDVGPAHYDLWGAQTVPAGRTLILTETEKVPPGGPDGNFDTSDFSPNPSRGDCNPVSYTAVVHLSLDGGSPTDYTDAGQVLNTGGRDAVACPDPGGSNTNDESQSWSLIGTDDGGGGGGPTGQPYHPLAPQRILDTRPGSGFGVDRQLGPGQRMTVQVSGAHGVPSGSTAAAVNVGVTNPNGAPSGYLLLYPSDQAQPFASTINFTAGQTIANLTQVALSANGDVTVYNAAGSVDVFLDLNGYYGPSSGPGQGLYNPLPSPVRDLDTRTAVGGHPGPLGPGGGFALKVDGVQGVPADAEAVALNLTEVDGDSPSYLAAWPDQTSWPGNSNLNFPAGRVLANRVIVQVGGNGSILIRNFAGHAHVLVDVAGWFSGGGGGDTTGRLFTPQNPTRIFDTRSGLGGHPGRIGPGEFVQVTAPAAITGAISMNVAVLDGSTYGFLGVYPGPIAPNTSDINFQPGDVLPNLAITRLDGGTFVIYNSAGAVDVFVDVNGGYG